ncbi:MAG: ABC transporter permease [Planctomycetota bacterium]|nr:ABC transporter permease [Planctomycetota bacterium]MDA1214643.1 ABC transporter permease [Planctomycetota bacterium]
MNTQEKTPTIAASPTSRGLKGWLSGVLGPFLALGAVYLFFAMADRMVNETPTFTDARNQTTIATHTASVAVAALGMTLIIISGGIDLSAGTALALSATVLAWCLLNDVAVLITQGDNVIGVQQRLNEANNELSRARRKPEENNVEAIEQRIADLQAEQDRLKSLAPRYKIWNATLSIFAALLTGCATGFLNGLLISTLRVIPFIVTLGTMTLYLGLAKIVANETTVRPNVGEQVPGWIQEMLTLRSESLYWGFPTGVWFVIALSIVLSLVLRYTVFGRYVFALGSNESTARLCGVNVTRNKIAVYTLAGLFVGIAGIYQFSRLKSGNPTSGTGMELQIIAAVVIGGGSLSGGRGSVLGTLTGATIMAVIGSGCVILGLKNPLQDIILGVIIVMAVVVDQLRQRRLQS